MSDDRGSGAASEPPRAARSGLVLITAVYAALGGAITLLGWALGAHRLADWGANAITMKANAAICALASGLALGLAEFRPRSRGAIRTLAGLVAALGVATLFEHAARVNLGIDTLLFDEPPGALATAAPGRMGVPASLSFIALGAALYGTTMAARGRRLAAALPLLPLAIVLLSLVGYLYGASELYAVGHLTGIAVQTASMIAALALGAIAAVPEYGPAAALKRADPGGVALRRALPGVLLLPVILGWLRLWGQQGHYFDAAFATAARTCVEVLLLAGLLWWTANGISRQAEAAAERERLLRTVSTEARVGLVLIDEHRRYLFANAMYAEVLGLPDAAIVGKRVQDVLGPLYQQAAPRLDLAFRGERVRYELHQPSHPSTGKEHFYEVAYEPRGAGAPTTQVVVVIVDVTVRKAAEQALREADRRKDEFLATLAHELRNPLAPLRNGLQIARRSGAGAAVARVHEMMDRQLEHLVRLVDDLLDVSRVSRGKIALQRQPLDLARVLESAIETSRPHIDRAEHELLVQLPPAPAVVDGDLTRLAQVFANLLNNAARYTPRGGRIVVAAERQGDEAVVRVRDNGVGIPPGHSATIFETFAQGDRTVERASGGLGIGLTLVKRLVEMHGGTVTVESPAPGEPGAADRPGSEFVVRLPALASATPALPAAATAQQPCVTGSRRRLRVLIADDNVDSADTLAMLLQDLGNEVRVAYDGAAALEAAELFRPDALVLDIGMPKVDGHEVARGIRGAPWGSGVVLIALTGWGQPEDLHKSTAAGFDHHLVKPVAPETLESILAGIALAVPRI